MRFGLHAVQLFYYHPALLSYLGVALISMLSIKKYYKGKNIYISMAILVIFMTLRSKGFGFIIIFYFLNAYVKWKNKIPKKIIIVLAILFAFFTAFDSFQMYFGQDGTARMTLLKDSIKIANKCNPIGGGFACFGSASAAKYYSPLYVKLGYRSRFGMGLNGGTFYLTDSFWPVLLAEFGYIGTVFFIWSLYRFIKSIIIEAYASNGCTEFSIKKKSHIY